MTADEISELAECLWSACAESVLPITPGHGKCCPFAALTFKSSIGIQDAAEITGLNDLVVGSFMHGFDDRPIYYNHDGRLYDLGRRFREQALGEGFK